jgi:hypothetical protein
MISENVAFGLAVLACVSLVFILYIHKTIIFGFTFLCFIQIASASLSAFVFGYIFNLDNSWITEDRLWVFTYSSLALIAFNLGVFIAWKPLRQRIGETASVRDVKVGERVASGQNMPWLNSNLVVLCLGLAVAAYTIAPMILGIPTFTAFWTSYLELLKLGVLLALLLAKIRGDYKTLIITMIVFWPVVILHAVITGFIGAAGNFLFQLLLVACFWNGLKAKAVPLFAGGVLLVICLAFGWLNSRDLIRGNVLVGSTPHERAVEFVSEFKYTNPMDLTPEDVEEMFFNRFDMSDILSAQVAQQPAMEPYEYGRGVVSEIGTILVPRFLWSGKPTRAGGSEYVSKYTGLEWNADTSIDLPYQFHFYVNGGAAMVIVGLFFVGWLVARVEIVLVDDSVSFQKFLCFFFLANTLGSGGGRFDVLIMTTVAGYLGYYLLGRILTPLNSGSWRFWKQGIIQPRPNVPNKLKSRLARWPFRLRPSG